MTKVVLITGASSGIGLANAQLFSSLGFRVYGIARHHPKVPFSFTFIQADMTDIPSLQQVLDTIIEKEKHLDILINNAGIGISGSCEETPINQVKHLFDVNVFGLIELTQLVIPYLRQSKGQIIHVSSVAGVIPIPFQTHYSMTKAAIITYTEGLRMELLPFGIRVSTVLPGDTKTGFTASRLKYEGSSLYGDRIKRSIQKMERDEQTGHNPLKVARVCVTLTKKKHPPVIVTVGVVYRIFLGLYKLLPLKVVHGIIYRLYGK